MTTETKTAVEQETTVVAFCSPFGGPTEWHRIHIAPSGDVRVWHDGHRDWTAAHGVGQVSMVRQSSGGPGYGYLRVRQGKGWIRVPFQPDINSECF